LFPFQLKIHKTDGIWLKLEMVLFLLIESFKFSLAPGKEIYWRTQGIAKPAIVGFDTFQLPLVVERAI